MRVLGRVSQGTGLGNQFLTPTKPVPPRRVGGIPVGFPNMYLKNNMLPLMRLITTVQYQNVSPMQAACYPLTLNPSIPHLQVIGMSFSGSLTVPMRRKRTISQRVTENGDPLVAKKKARDATNKLSKTKKGRQPSIEDVSDNSDNDLESTTRPHKAIPKKASSVLELADGSEDDDVPDPIVVDDSDKDDSEGAESDQGEAPAESAEAELSKCWIRVYSTILS